MRRSDVALLMTRATATRLRAPRRRLAATLVVLMLAGSVIAAHGALAMGHMGMDHMGKAAMVCLAIADAAALGIGALLAVAAPSRRGLTFTLFGPLVAVTSPRAATPGARARAGPAVLQVFRL